MATKASLNLCGLFVLLLVMFSYGSHTIMACTFRFREATIDQIKNAFLQNRLTSRELVQCYLGQIQKLNPILSGVIEVNPDALSQADTADYERRTLPWQSLPILHGIPVLLKDNIATKDKMNNTAGSFALLGSVVPRDSGVASKLRQAGAILLGKASLNEWSSFRTNISPNGWSARGGYGKNPYVLSADPCGSSSGSAISTAANLVSVSISTQANGSILCPANQNSIVGIKPTVCLVSRDQTIPCTNRQDTSGPTTRTVSDAVYVLDAIVGPDYNDPPTVTCARNIPPGGYRQYLKCDGLVGKRLGVVRTPYLNLINSPYQTQVFERHLRTLRRRGAVVIDNLEIPHMSDIQDVVKSGEKALYYAEFKLALNAYLQGLVDSPVRSLEDVINFNIKNPELEKLNEYGQDFMLEAQKTNGIGPKEREALENLARLSREGFEKLIKDYDLDAVVTPGSQVYHVLDIGGYPGINVPAGYTKEGVPFGISFSGLNFSEPTLIEVAYAFEQATKVRKPPTYRTLELPYEEEVSSDSQAI